MVLCSTVVLTTFNVYDLQLLLSITDTGFGLSGLPAHVQKLRKTINTLRIKAVATTVVEEAKA